MGLTNWIKKKLGGKSRPISPTGDQGQFYYLLNYDEEYKELLSVLPDRRTLLAELFLFRFWLTQYGYRLSRSDGVSEDDLLGDIIPNGLTLGKGIFERTQRIDIEKELGDSLTSLMEDRFKAYDFAITIGKSPTDPFGMIFASMQLAKRLVDEPITELNAYLADKAKKQFIDITALHTGSKDSAERVLGAASDSKKWRVVNEFGECKTLVDESSIRTSGNRVRARVLYDLKPSGTDKRNNKPVRQMIMDEEYDLSQETFRVFQINFVYEDGSPCAPVKAEPTWKSATAGNKKTMEALRGLVASRGGA